MISKIERPLRTTAYSGSQSHTQEHAQKEEKKGQMAEVIPFPQPVNPVPKKILSLALLSMTPYFFVQLIEAIQENLLRLFRYIGRRAYPALVALQKKSRFKKGSILDKRME